METLDLHGVRHHQVDRLAENFVLLNDLPVRIIPGNSQIMQEIVQKVLDRHGLKQEPEHYWNLGSWIIREAKS